MLRRERVDGVLISHLSSLISRHFSRLHLVNLHPKRHPLHPQLDRALEQLLRPLGPVQPDRLLATLEPQRPQQPDYPEEMIGVKVREKDLGQGEAHPKAHHLALGAFAALEQQRLALAHQGEAGDVALDGGPGRRGTEKRETEHSGRI